MHKLEIGLTVRVVDGRLYGRVATDRSARSGMQERGTIGATAQTKGVKTIKGRGGPMIPQNGSLINLQPFVPLLDA